MAETRIKGGEVSIRLTVDSVFIAELTAVKDTTITFDLAVIKEGYLGEKTVRKDDIFNGITGSFAVVAEDQALFILIDKIVKRAQRDPSALNVRINLVGRFSFPNGQTPRLLVRDLKFGPIPVTVPGRDQYVGATFPFDSEAAVVLTT